jgi:hypothetical protein
VDGVDGHSVLVHGRGFETPALVHVDRGVTEFGVRPGPQHLDVAELTVRFHDEAYRRATGTVLQPAERFAFVRARGFGPELGQILRVDRQDFVVVG